MEHKTVRSWCLKIVNSCYWICKPIWQCKQTAKIFPLNVHTTGSYHRETTRSERTQETRALVTSYIDHCSAGYCRHDRAPSGYIWNTAKQCEHFWHSNETGEVESSKDDTRSFRVTPTHIHRHLKSTGYWHSERNLPVTLRCSSTSTTRSYMLCRAACSANADSLNSFMILCYLWASSNITMYLTLLTHAFEVR